MSYWPQWKEPDCTDSNQWRNFPLTSSSNESRTSNKINHSAHNCASSDPYRRISHGSSRFSTDFRQNCSFFIRAFSSHFLLVFPRKHRELERIRTTLADSRFKQWHVQFGVDCNIFHGSCIRAAALAFVFQIVDKTDYDGEHTRDGKREAPGILDRSSVLSSRSSIWSIKHRSMAKTVLKFRIFAMSKNSSYEEIPVCSTISSRKFSAFKRTKVLKWEKRSSHSSKKHGSWSDVTRTECFVMFLSSSVSMIQKWSSKSSIVFVYCFSTRISWCRRNWLSAWFPSTNSPSRQDDNASDERRTGEWRSCSFSGLLNLDLSMRMFEVCGTVWAIWRFISLPCSIRPTMGKWTVPPRDARPSHLWLSQTSYSGD